MLERMDATIVAVSSAPGSSPLGLVRLSGPEAVGIVDRMANLEDGRPLAARMGWTRTAGELLIDEERSLPAAFYLFRAPRSYTRQDIVEIHTVGAVPVLELVRQRAIALGALAAEPGEFTARAFFNGAMDLGQAEAVAGVIRARTDTQLRASRRMMDGALARETEAIREELAALLALVEADIDFAEEPIEFITPDELVGRLNAIADPLRKRLARSISVERFDVLPHILLLGPPNAGKSTLLNRLSGTPRAICAAAAGTTRDILSAAARLGRRDVILLDSAGVDRSEDEVLAQARDMTMRTAQHVDLICVVVDLSADCPESFLHEIQRCELPGVVVAANKMDLVTNDETAAACRRLTDRALGPVQAVSAIEGTGLDGLRSVLAEAIAPADTTALSESMLISERQREALRQASEGIDRAMSLAVGTAETIDRADVIAFELREAMDALGSVVGGVTTEELLARVFADFCIGK